MVHSKQAQQKETRQFETLDTLIKKDLQTQKAMRKQEKERKEEKQGKNAEYQARLDRIEQHRRNEKSELIERGRDLLHRDTEQKRMLERIKEEQRELKLA